MKNLLGGLGGKKGPSVVGVDVGASSAKVVQIRKEKGRAILETYGEIALGPYGEKAVGQAVNIPPSAIGRALQDVMRESKVTTKSAGFGIPLASSLITTMDVPVADQAKLQSIIPIEARKYIPVPIGEVLLDWHLIPQAPSDQKEGGPKSEVLLVAIHKDTIGQAQEIVTNAALEVSFFEIEVFSTIRSVLDRGIAPVMVIDFGARSTKLYIVEAGMVRDSHIINQGGQDITTALSRSLEIPFEKAEQMKRTFNQEMPDAAMVFETASNIFDYILSEARRVMMRYQQKHNTSISRVFLSGGGALWVDMGERTSKALDAEVIVADPFTKLEAPAFLQDVLQNAGPEFAVAIGIALRKLEEFA